MKYLKTFENITSQEVKNLKKGDYLIVKMDDDRIDDELVIFISHGNKNKLMSVELPDYEGEYLIYPHEIVKKLTKEEAKIFTTANKYNL